MPARQSPVRCPRCGLTLSFRAPWMQSQECAHCRAHAHLAVRLEPISTLDSPALRRISRGTGHERPRRREARR